MRKSFLMFGLMFILMSGSMLFAAQATATWSAVVTNVNGGAITGVSYNIYRGPNADGSAATKLNTTALAAVTYVDTSVGATTTYYFYVTAVSSTGTEGPKSTVVRFNASDSVPAAPTNFTVN